MIDSPGEDFFNFLALAFRRPSVKYLRRAAGVLPNGDSRTRESLALFHQSPNGIQTENDEGSGEIFQLLRSVGVRT